MLKCRLVGICGFEHGCLLLKCGRLLQCLLRLLLLVHCRDKHSGIGAVCGMDFLGASQQIIGRGRPFFISWRPLRIRRDHLSEVLPGLQTALVVTHDDAGWLGLEGLPDVDSVPQPSIQVRFVQLSIKCFVFWLVVSDGWGIIALYVGVRCALLRQESGRWLAFVFTGLTEIF